MNTKGMSVGFVGLGNQGGPIAARILAAGFPLALWARRKEVLDAFAGATKVDDLAELARTTDVIGICVLDDRSVRDVFEGLKPGLRAGCILLIHATVHPQLCRDLAREAEQLGVALIDAPVSGGAAGAHEGKLTVMCGGDPAVIDRCRPLIDSFAGLVVRLGDVGAGQQAKLINNAMMAANMGIAHAAGTLALAIGVDKAALDKVVAASSGRSFGHDVYARLPAPNAFGDGAKLLRKDLDLLGSIVESDGDKGELLFTAATRFLDESEGRS